VYAALGDSSTYVSATAWEWNWRESNPRPLHHNSDAISGADHHTTVSCQPRKIRNEHERQTRSIQ